MENTIKENAGKFCVYIERNEFGIDGRVDTKRDWVCDGSEPRLEQIGEFDTEEEAKSFIDNYDLQGEFNEVVNHQGYGSAEVRLYVMEGEGEEQLFTRSMKSNQGDNATKTYSITMDTVDGDGSNAIVTKFGTDYAKAQEAFKSAVETNAYEARHNRAFKIDEEYGLGNTYRARVTLVEERLWGEEMSLTETEELESKIIGYLDDGYKNQPTKADFCTDDDYTDGVKEWAENVMEWRFDEDIDEDNVELPRR